MKARDRAAAGSVRLIGGIWKKSKLAVKDIPGLRPTPDRVRVTLFNWLGADLSGWRVLDAFAGTGALGLEAASRGAAQVMLLERDPSAATALVATHLRLGAASSVQIQRAEALSWMARNPAAQFDLIFLDPPFEADLWQASIAAARALLPDGGWLYVEAAEQLQPPAGLVPHRHFRAGAVQAHLWRRAMGALAAPAQTQTSGASDPSALG